MDVLSRLWIAPVCTIPGEGLEEDGPLKREPNPRWWERKGVTWAEQHERTPRLGHEPPDPYDPSVTIVVSTSGGKDSSALASKIVREHGLPGNQTTKGYHRLVFAHADTGMEWPDAEEVAEAQVAHLGSLYPEVADANGSFPFGVIAHKMLDDDYVTWLDEIPRKGAFPSEQTRWCTSDFKRDPIDKWLRTGLGIPLGTVEEPNKYLVAIGIRALEGLSRNRQRWGYKQKTGGIKPGWSDPERYMDFRERASRRDRLAWNWFPVYEWSGDDDNDRPKEADGAPGPKVEPTIGKFWDGEDAYAKLVPDDQDVWTEIRTYGLPIGQAYKEGMRRMSCQFCIMGNAEDFAIAAKQFPELFRRIGQIERDLARQYEEEPEKKFGSKTGHQRWHHKGERLAVPMGATLKKGMWLDELFEQRPDLAPGGVPSAEPGYEEETGGQLRMFNPTGGRRRNALVRDQRKLEKVGKILAASGASWEYMPPRGDTPAQVEVFFPAYEEDTLLISRQYFGRREYVISVHQPRASRTTTMPGDSTAAELADAAIDFDDGFVLPLAPWPRPTAMAPR